MNNIVWRVGRFILEGEFSTYNTYNGRIYPEKFMRKELKRLKKEMDLKLRQKKLERILNEI